MHRGVFAVSVVGLCSPALLGCSGDTPQAAPTSSPPTSSISTTSPPTTTPPTTPTGPTLPSLTQQESVAGARSFIRIYFRAINSSINARSSSFLRRYSTSECITCRGIAKSMDEIRRDHGFYHGGDWNVTSVTPIAHQARDRPILHIAVTVTAGTWKRSPTDHLRTIKADKMYVDAHLTWAKSHWLVSSIVSAS